MEKKTALVEDGTITKIIIGEVQWAIDNLGGNWIDVSNTKCAKGWTYTEENGLIPKQPFNSWTWNGTEWVAPIEKPDNDNFWIWDESSQSWTEY